MEPLSLGFSPCPNDTFIFHALVHGIIPLAGLSFRPHLADVEKLNELAVSGRLDVTKVSFGALPYLLDEYLLLRSGGAVGRGCGPLIVARRDISIDDLGESVRIAIPGRLTTANLLLRLFRPDAAVGIEMEYDLIMPAVAAGEVDAGLIIHESRFTFAEYGLKRVVDLGEWWEATTGAPIPLGAIVARRALGETTRVIERLIRESLQHALRSPDDSAAFVRAHAQELSADVTRQHIELYVNEFSVELGREGDHAVRELMRRAEASGLIFGGVGEQFRASGPV
jgi:1,4-dihydroxy-6-naphthoate synthase